MLKNDHKHGAVLFLVKIPEKNLFREGNVSNFYSYQETGDIYLYFLTFFLPLKITSFVVTKIIFRNFKRPSVTNNEMST